MAKKWKDVEPNTWKPKEEGDYIEGVLISKEPRDNEKDISSKYYLENGDGKFLVWGSAILDERLGFIPVGTEIRIIFDGKKSIQNNRTLNQYRVQIADDEDGEEPSSPTVEKQQSENLPTVEQV